VDRTDAQTLARSLMNAHGLEHWRFAFGRGKNRLGCCDYTTRTISLSADYVDLNPEPLIRNTILHEIAHALTPGAKHGPVWKSMCLRIGARAERLARASEVVMSPSKYVLACPCCNVKEPRHRRPTRNYYCGACYQRTRARHVLVLRHNL
jgi:predicted SprT family Zn-dependent metalloprotease